MEPERKIEKLLRAYAKKRRADGGDAFKLHPATRRRLQSEVARQAPKPEDEPESLSLWEVLRERWAVLLGFALIIFFGATLFLPGLSSAKKKSANVETMAKLKQLGAAAQIATLDNLTNVLRSSDVLTDTVSGQRFVYRAGGANLGALQSNNVLAYSPAEKDREELLADGSVHSVKRDQFSALTNQTLLTVAFAQNAPAPKPVEQPAPAEVALALPALAPAATPPAASEPAVASDSVNRATATPTSSVSGAISAGEFAAAGSARRMAAETLAPAQNSQKFKSELMFDKSDLGINNSQRYRQVVNAKMPQVLDSFELQQNGNQISVVDRDGSVYNGTLQSVELASDSSKNKTTQIKPGAANLLQKEVAANQNNQQAAQNYFFRVSGANRSLKQNVVFSGNLLPISNATANVAQKFQNFGGGSGGIGGQSKLADAAAAQQQLFYNSRIEGTVTIGQTNQIEINALPVP